MAKGVSWGQNMALNVGRGRFKSIIKIPKEMWKSPNYVEERNREQNSIRVN